MDDPQTCFSDGLLARLAHHAKHRPDAPAYRMRARGRVTYQALLDRVNSTAHWLHKNLPDKAVVILSCPSDLEYPGVFLGILAAGCTVFPVSVDASAVELQRAASESAAACVIGDERATKLLTKTHNLISRRAAETSHAAMPVDFRMGDLLLQSSGTTGLPKIARRSGASLDAVARATADAVGFTVDDRVLMTVPLTHSYGLEHGLLAPIWAGSCVHLCPGLDLQILLPELAAGITLFPGVPSTFEMLANLPGEPLSMPALRIAYAAGAPLPATVFEQFLSRYGVRVTQLYGATEIGSVTFNPAGEPFERTSVGRGMQDVSIRILDVERTNKQLERGDEGQIAIQAPSMFCGYLNADSELVDGHFLTGDLGRIDETGRLFVTGRIKLLIDVGGMKVNPLEVESVLQQHRAVAACVVIATRQTATINRLKAIIEPHDPQNPPAVEELRQLARANLSAYKCPRFFEFRSPLPRSTVGKILRHLLEVE